MSERRNTIQSLISLAKALKENPLYLSAVLVIYLNGYFLNSFFFTGNSPHVWLVPELACGLVWSVMTAIPILASCQECMPLSLLAAKYVLVACMVIATGTLGIFLIMMLLDRAIDGIVKEVFEIYSMDLRFLPWVVTFIFGLISFIYLVRLVLRTSKVAIKKVSSV